MEGGGGAESRRGDTQEGGLGLAMARFTFSLVSHPPGAPRCPKREKCSFAEIRNIDSEIARFARSARDAHFSRKGYLLGTTEEGKRAPALTTQRVPGAGGAQKRMKKV